MSGPMDCADRINVMSTERVLEPVRMLAEVADLSAVTVRALCEGRRFDVTVRKAWPEGTDAAPAFRWELLEVGEGGEPAEGGFTAGGSPDTPAADPEDAYWSAVEALAGLAAS